MWTIYTDGACNPNPGSGGWAVVILDESGAVVEELSGAEPTTTNNRMELTAAIRGIEWVPMRSRVKIVSDSKYLVNGATSWMYAWSRRSWMRGDNEVLNRDLWMTIFALVKTRTVKWSWVKGHGVDKHNCRADDLAEAKSRSIAAQPLQRLTQGKFEELMDKSHQQV